MVYFQYFPTWRKSGDQTVKFFNLVIQNYFFQLLMIYSDELLENLDIYRPN